MPSGRSGMKISQTPDGMRRRMMCARPSQRLKSPMTLTRCAFGAQTAKCTPVDARRSSCDARQTAPTRDSACLRRTGAGRNRSVPGRIDTGRRPPAFRCPSRTRNDTRIPRRRPSSGTVASNNPSGRRRCMPKTRARRHELHIRRRRLHRPDDERRASVDDNGDAVRGSANGLSPVPDTSASSASSKACAR